jgi:hypothetical protein
MLSMTPPCQQTPDKEVEAFCLRCWVCIINMIRLLLQRPKAYHSNCHERSPGSKETIIRRKNDSVEGLYQSPALSPRLRQLRVDLLQIVAAAILVKKTGGKEPNPHLHRRRYFPPVHYHRLRVALV